jgi:transposase InsO family protein
MKYEFILKNDAIYSVEKMCKYLNIARSSYYYWFDNKDNIASPLQEKTLLLDQRIRFVFEESRQIYGSYRIQKALEREGLKYARSYISKRMKFLGLKSVLRRKYVVTTNSNHSLPLAKNILNRDFYSLEIGKKWISDITYIRVNNDWMYLTTIIDLADRKVVGWSLSEDMTTENTVLKAWFMARKKRNIQKDFIFHSDRGVQYAAKRMINLFNLNTKITQSMSRKGNCWDNAVAESFFKTIKHEWLYRFRHKSFQELYISIEDYINWYNTKRLHSSLGYRTPLEMEIKLNIKIKKAA